jgi:hypothetical protein
MVSFSPFTTYPSRTIRATRERPCAWDKDYKPPATGWLTAMPSGMMQPSPG